MLGIKPRWSRIYPRVRRRKLSLLSLCRLVNRGENLKNYEFSRNDMVYICIPFRDLWTSTVSYNVNVIMNGHLTFLEWTVIMAVLIYLTTEVILWIKYLN